MSDFKQIINDIELATNRHLNNVSSTSVGGGCINMAYQLSSDNGSYFIKLNHTHLLSMFEAEAAGLKEFEQLDCVRVPKVICYGVADGHSYLALEYIKLSGLRGGANQILGQQLAQLHRQPQAFFGWHCDNTIGSTPQYNPREHDWATFWLQHRLAPQLTLARKNGFGGKLQDKGLQLMDQLHYFFAGYTPSPSLLHGDLWGGNAAADPQGNPVVFDPACYYGDRETDVAMTELFGGFASDFYHAYQAEYPLDPGYKTRKTLYNLYHILNHVNLFGGGYSSQAESMMNQLLAEIK